MERRRKLIEYYQFAGSKIEFNLTGHMSYKKGVGPQETLVHSDGRVSKVVIPKMHYNSKCKTRFPNLKWTVQDYKKRALGILPWKERSFTSQMPSVSKECLNGPNYYFEDGLRKVEPYFDVLKTYITEKHYPGPGVNIIDYFENRFPAYTRKYFEIILSRKHLAVNCEVVDADYVLQDGDVVSHLIHRHEHDIVDAEVKIISETDELLVVNKPTSWPVYPIGNYRFNSLIYILMRDYGYRDLRTIHRIDAATSGICILVKKPGISGKFQKFFKERNVQKEYVALVDGKFPDFAVSDEPLNYYKISPRKLVQFTEQKSAKTVFHLISYHAFNDTSLVRCVPVTGRTHQIRLHLECLGYFIVNDYLYNKKDYAEEITEFQEKQLMKALEMMEKNKLINKSSNDLNKEFRYPYCVKCQSSNIIPINKPSQMCLHSFKYSFGQDIVFESQLPSWADSPETVR